LHSFTKILALQTCRYNFLQKDFKKILQKDFTKLRILILNFNFKFNLKNFNFNFTNLKKNLQKD